MVLGKEKQAKQKKKKKFFVFWVFSLVPLSFLLEMLSFENMMLGAAAALSL